MLVSLSLAVARTGALLAGPDLGQHVAGSSLTAGGRSPCAVPSMNVVDERFVALVGTDLLVQQARCGHTRVFGLTSVGRKTLRQVLHAGPLTAVAAI